MPTILLKKSDTPSAVPTTANLTNLAGGAEVAVNTADKRLFTMDSSSAVVELGTNPTNLTTASLTVTTGNAAFTGTAQRITGDMSNATIANRLALQTTTANSATNVHAIPNGTSVNSGFKAESDPAMANGQFLALDMVGNTDARISSSTRGSGTAVPITFYTDGSEKMRIDTAGKITDQYGNIRAIPRTGAVKTSSYTLAITDVGQFVEISTGGSVIVPDSTFSAGDVVSTFNNTTGNVTLTMSIATAYIAGTDADKATITLATRGVATILFVSGTGCVVSGNVS